MKQYQKNRELTAAGWIWTGLILAPTTCLALPAGQLQENFASQMSLTSWLILGSLLGLTLLIVILFTRRLKASNIQLKDITNELDQTRGRLSKTSKELDHTAQELKTNTDRFQNILLDAEVGTFQIDLNGKCTYINSALQTLSGLYPKKAIKEGLQSAIHPDEIDRYNQAWIRFTEENEPFNVACRFVHPRGREVHVIFQANKIRNAHKETESYIGWVSDITPLRKEQVQQETLTARYAHFIEDTIEGFYQLAPATPIPLNTSPEKIADAILKEMKLVDCTKTFAAMLGTTKTELINNASYSRLEGAPLNSLASVQHFITANFKQLNKESTIRDSRGSRINLTQNMVGLIEENQLVGIWGSQRNITQQKRQEEEQYSQTQFMHRIINALPASIHVKDTRCRYLYSSKKLADRTGIPQEEWIGKTIYEVMPGTPRDHDKKAIESMKNGKLSRTEHPYEASGKSGWMETFQIPLISDQGLVEGVIGMSLEISEQKQREQKLRTDHTQLTQQLKERTSELINTQTELQNTEQDLRGNTQKLQTRNKEIEQQEHAFAEQLAERKRSEEIAQRNEERLLSQQKSLEEKLSKQLAELTNETHKRRKWEELITIKETEIRKLEHLTKNRQTQLDEEIILRKQTLSELTERKTELEQALKTIDQTETVHQQQVEELIAQKEHEVRSESEGRARAESQLKKNEALVLKTQLRIKTLSEQHAAALEHETKERNSATAKLLSNTQELDELKQRFNLEIEKETKLLKQELAQKQVREKSLRKHEKDLEGRIKQLETMLQHKTKESEEQIRARKGAEEQYNQIEKKCDQLTHSQKKLIERETEKLNIAMAEVQLNEIKLRKEIGELQQAQTTLENTVETRTTELSNATQQHDITAALLTETQDKLSALAQSQETRIGKETAALKAELEQFKQTESELKKQEASLQNQCKTYEQALKTNEEQIKLEQAQREKIETELEEMLIAFNASQDNVSELLEIHTKELQHQIDQLIANEATMQQSEQELQQQAEQLQLTLTQRTNELTKIQTEREKAEADFNENLSESRQKTDEIENRLTQLKDEHTAEIQRLYAEQNHLQQNEKHYRLLFKDSSDAFLQLNPKTGIIEKSNDSAAKLFGVDSINTLEGKTLSVLSPKQDPKKAQSPDLAKARLHTALETGQNTFEWQFQRSDESIFSALVSLSAIHVDDQQFISAVIIDISSIRKQINELQNTIHVVQTANLENSQVVDNLNDAIHGALEPVVISSKSLEKAENITIEQRLDMAIINRNSRSLIDMIDHSTELTRLADGTDQVKAEKYNLHELIQELDQQFSQRAETKNLFFAVSYAQYHATDNVPKMVSIDQHKLRKIISTLLNYALAHTEKGRLGLHAARKNGNMADNNMVTFELAYTGSMQQDELLSQVFGKEPSGPPNNKDMQFGLTLTKRYIDILGGKIELGYRQGGVTALSIDIPIMEQAPELIISMQKDSAAGAA